MGCKSRRREALSGRHSRRYKETDDHGSDDAFLPSTSPEDASLALPLRTVGKYRATKGVVAAGMCDEL